MSGIPVEAPAAELHDWKSSVGATYLLRRLLQKPMGLLGSAILIVNLLVFLAGPVVAPYDPTATGVGLPVSPPSADHWLGTDALGRDVLSRLLSGGGEVILLPLAAVALAFAVGGFTGMLAGYLGGRFDLAVMAVTNVMLSIPSLLLALVIIAGFGASALTIVLTIALVYSSRVARMLRSAVRNVRTREFVEAAEAAGGKARDVVLREILPNITGPLMVEFSVRFSYAVILVTSLSFLGLGAQPPSANWGLMISESRDILTQVPAAALGPALATALLIVGIILITDTLANELERESLTESR